MVSPMVSVSSLFKLAGWSRDKHILELTIAALMRSGRSFNLVNEINSDTDLTLKGVRLCIQCTTLPDLRARAV